MKNFDTARASRRRPEDERSFKLADHVYVLKAGVRPEALTGFDEIDEDSPVSLTMQKLDELFFEMVEDREGSHDAYLAARADEIDPLTLEDLNELIEWMIEQVTGRPTGSPSASTDGGEETGTSSTGGSSSPASTAVSRA